MSFGLTPYALSVIASPTSQRSMAALFACDQDDAEIFSRLYLGEGAA